MSFDITTRRPYFIRAMYDWLIDNGLTPQLLVDTSISGVKVPVAHIQPDGNIVLNIAPVAIRNLQLGLAVITFNAAFPGLKADISLPISSIKAIYALENSESSMLFSVELDGRIATDKSDSAIRLVGGKKETSKTKSTASLKIIKKTNKEDS